MTAKLYKHIEKNASDLDRPFIYLRSPKESKGETALNLLNESPVDSGLVCLISTVENCSSMGLEKIIKLAIYMLVLKIENANSIIFISSTMNLDGCISKFKHGSRLWHRFISTVESIFQKCWTKKILVILDMITPSPILMI